MFAAELTTIVLLCATAGRRLESVWVARQWWSAVVHGKIKNKCDDLLWQMGEKLAYLNGD